MVKEIAKRSRTGCLTCRKRKIKCDETRPRCKQCIKHGFSCEWPIALSRVIPKRRVTIRSALSDRHIACANSLILSKQDRLSLEYFPSSAVYGLYDFFKYGALQYLVKIIAPRSKLVTRMILALSASEMHQNGLRIHDNHSLAKRGIDEGLIYYTQAIQGLMKDISSSAQDDQVDAKLTALIFMIHYELQFTGSIDRMQIHLRGFWALICNNPLFDKRQANDKRSISDPQLVLSCQLTGWALYLDIAAITIFGASSSLLKSVLSSDNPALNTMRLYRLSRLGDHRLWGQPLSDEDLRADDELYRPVELGWQVMLTRFSIWDLVSGKSSDRDKTASCLQVQNHLLDLREKYHNVLHTANEAPKGRWTSSIEVITRFAAFYWASILFYHRMLNDHYPSLTPQHDLHQEAKSSLIKLLYYRHKQNGDLRKQSRLVWCYYMAAIDTPDPVHRDWLVERLAEVRDVSVECRHLWSTACTILGNNVGSQYATKELI